MKCYLVSLLGNKVTYFKLERMVLVDIFEEINENFVSEIGDKYSVEGKLPPILKNL